MQGRSRGVFVHARLLTDFRCSPRASPREPTCEVTCPTIRLPDRLRFVARCRDDRAALDALRLQAGVPPWLRDTPARAQLIALAHRVAGGGGTFGFRELSEAAYRCETSLIASERPGLGPEAAIEGLANALAAAVERA